MQKKLNIWLVAIFLFCLAVSAPWFDVYVSNHSFVKSYVGGIGSGILFLITLYFRKDVGILNVHITPIKLALLSLFLLGTLSIFWSVNVDFTITKWLIWLSVFFSFFTAYHLNLNQENLYKFCWGAVFAASGIAIIGILQYLFDPFSLTQAATPASTFGNKNMATQPIILILPLSLFLFFSDRINSKGVWLLTIMTALIMAFIFYTKTRGAWLSIFVEFVLIMVFLIAQRKRLTHWFFWNKSKRNASIFAIVLFFLLINISSDGWAPFWYDFSSTISKIGEDAINSKYSRYQIWQVAWHMIKDSPWFGTGLGTWFENEIQGGYGSWSVLSYQRVHNDMLELGVELGFVGLGLFVVVVVALLSAFWKIVKLENNSSAWFYYLLFVCLSASFVNMQFSFPYQLAMPAVLFGLYVGLIAKKSEQFLPRISLIELNFSPALRRSIFGFWAFIFIVTSAVYYNWIGVYSIFNNMNQTLKFNRLNNINPLIYHLEIQNILGFLSQFNFQHQNYQNVIKLEEKILAYWPDADNSLYRYAYALFKQKKYNKALKVVKKLKKIAPMGSYRANIVELQIYQQEQDAQKFQQAFEVLYFQKERLLALDEPSYRFLLAFSASHSNLQKYTLDLYQKYTKYYGYRCSVENNIIAFYIARGDSKNAKAHFGLVLKNESEKCLNTALIDKIKMQ